MGKYINMHTYFSYRDGHNFGNTAYFCLIPHYLQLDDCQFGQDVAEMDVEVLLRPPLNREGLVIASDQIGSRKIEPTFKFIKSFSKLKIVYPSRFFYQRQAVNSDGVESQRFKDHYEEFRDVIRILGPKIAKSCDFDYRKLLVRMDGLIDKLPQNDTALLLLKEYSRQRIVTGLGRVTKSNPNFCASSIPDLIPIKNYHDEIGHFENGFQFISGIFGEFDLADIQASATLTPSFAKATQCLLAVLHKFTPDGSYLATEVAVIPRLSSSWTVDRQLAADKLMAMIESLPKLKYCDVLIRTFKIQIGAEVFGLVDTSSEESGSSVTLLPNNWYFQPPWNGDFQT